MQQQHRESLARSLCRPDALAEEVDLPERVGVDLEKLAPRFPVPAGIGIYPVHDQGVSDRLPRDLSGAQFSQFAKNPAVPAVGIPCELYHQLPEDFGNLRAAFSWFNFHACVRAHPAPEC